jgi:hypothetical protein
VPICLQILHVKFWLSIRVPIDRYATGNKRCQICDLFIKWDGFYCPCCGRKLRIGPRCFKFKARLKKQKAIEEAKSKRNIILSIQS